MALKIAMRIVIQRFTPCGSIFCVLIMILFFDANIHIFSNMEDFFSRAGVRVGMCGGARWEAPAGGWGAGESGRRRRGGGAGGRRGEGSTGTGAGRRVARGGNAPATMLPRPRRPSAPPPRRRRPRVGPGCGRCVGACALGCFTWNIHVTGLFSARCGSPQLPRLLQTYRN